MCFLSRYIREKRTIFWIKIIHKRDILLRSKKILQYNPPPWSLLSMFLLKRFFCPQDMIGLLRSNLGIFLLWIFGVIWDVGLYLSTRGCNLAAPSIHASLILRRWLTSLQLPKGFLGLRIVECRNSSDILEWGPGALQTGNIALIAPNHVKAQIGYPEVPIAGNHGLSPYYSTLPFFIISFLHHQPLGSIHLASFLLGKKHAHFRCESCWQPILRHPTFGRWS